MSEARPDAAVWPDVAVWPDEAVWRWAAPNGEPVSPLSCFALGHDWSGWVHDYAAGEQVRVCRRVGCGWVQTRWGWDEGGEG